MGDFMKQAVKLALLVAIAPLLAGCSQALAPSDVTVSLSVGEWANALTGDQAKLKVDVQLPAGSSTEYEIGLEQQSDSGTWSEVGSPIMSAGSKQAYLKADLSEPGSFIYRAVIKDKAGQRIKSSATASIQVFDLSLGVRKLYYDEAQACLTGEDDCLQYRIQNGYPGLYARVSAADLEVAKSTFNWIGQGVPDTSTITPDANWVVPSRPCMDKFYALDVSKPLPGRTFIVTVGDHESHVTFLDGKFYYYHWLCK
jgi:hypothetical protein